MTRGIDGVVTRPIEVEVEDRRHCSRATGRAMTTCAGPSTVRGAPWMRFAAPGGGGGASGRGGGATGRGGSASGRGGVRAGGARARAKSVADVSTRAGGGAMAARRMIWRCWRMPRVAMGRCQRR